MKYLMLIAGGIVDESLENLGGRTPLEAAKKPCWDSLAKEGVVGSVSLTPPALPASGDVACLSLLGFDPEEFYTGAGPLEAPVFGVPVTDRDVVFRCDFVTVDSERLVDPFAGHVGLEESRRLIEELDRKLGGGKVRFYPGEGYKNFLVCGDEELANSLDDLVCENPEGLTGEKISRRLPKGKRAEAITEMMERAKTVLESHEINRVRIDLGENPANAVWLWGHGRRLKLPSFKQRHAMSAAAVGAEDFVGGLAKALEMKRLGGLEEALEAADFVFFYQGLGPAKKKEETLASKIRFIESFDAEVLSEAVRLKGRFKDMRVCVSTDTGAALAKPMPFHAQVPFLVTGAGEGRPGFFSEKAGAQSALSFEDGPKFLDFFLKGQ